MTATTALALILPVAPVAAESGVATLHGVQVTFTTGDTARFDGPGCARLPVWLTYSRPADRGFRFDYEARQPGSNDSLSDEWIVYDDDSSTSGTLSGSFCFGEYDYSPDRGPLQVSGVVTVRDTELATLGEAPVPAGSVRVLRNQSDVTRLTAKYSKRAGELRVKGRVTAWTPSKGRIGADGAVEVDLKVKKRWISMYTPGADSFGRFTASAYSSNEQIGKAKVRVRLSDCYWCTDVSRTVRVN